MMKKAVLSIMIVLILTLPLATSVLAHEAAPVGGCPTGFHLHDVMDHSGHSGEHMHQQVGTDADQNGDGFICVLHVGNNEKIHVHVDNSLPLN